MSFGIKADFNKGETEDLKPIEQKPIEQKVEPVKQQVEPIKEDIKEPIGQEALKTPPTTELNDDVVSAYLKNKYKEHEFNTVDDLFKKPEVQTKEVEKIVNPWEGVMDDETKAYLEFRKDTGRSRKEFEFLAQDISAKTPLELSREKVRQEAKMPLTNAQADEYLEKKLGIDLSDPDLSSTDKIELASYSNSYKEQQLAQQDKYRKPLDEVLKAKQNTVQEKFIELDNGIRMSESQFKQFESKQLEHQEAIKKAVDSVASFDFKIPIDSNGEKSTLDISYDISKDGKHSMLSDALDINAAMDSRFLTKEGFNHSEYVKTIHKGLYFDEILAAAAKQVRAATIEEFTANSNNENFEARPMQKVKTGKEGYGQLPSGDSRPRTFGVRASKF